VVWLTFKKIKKIKETGRTGLLDAFAGVKKPHQCAAGVLHVGQGMPRFDCVTVSNSSQSVSALHLLHCILQCTSRGPSPYASETCIKIRRGDLAGFVSGNMSSVRAGVVMA